MSLITPYQEGDPESRLVLIGEAPSYQEIREQRPFVGPAGQLLDRCLQAAQISRSQSYILNVFETEIVKRKNDASKIYAQNGELLWTSAKGFTDAGRDASRGCLERLRKCSANIFVPLGAPALHLCTDTRSISKWRGSIIQANEALSQRKVVPTLHPSFALQGAYEARYLVVADLKRARAESSSPEIRLPQRNLIIDPTFDQALSYLQKALDAEAIDTDIEILSGQVDCFSVALSPSDAISIPLITEGFEHRWTAAEEVQIWLAYARLIGSERICKINQNIVFDLATLLQLNHIVPRGPIADPMVAFAKMNPFLEKGLGTICSLYTREPYYKDDGELHDSHTIDDFARRWLYNAKDAAIAMECWQGLEPLLDKENYRVPYEMTMDMASSLIFMMVNGARINAADLRETKIKTQAKIKELIKRMEPVFGRPIITEAPKKAAEKRAVVESGAINIRSPAQIASYFYDEKKLRPYTNKTGARTVDDLALARIVRRDGLQEAKLLQEYRKLDTMLTRYLDIGYDRDERLRCSYNICGTWTGRLSSSQTVFRTGGNTQNIPEEMRGFIVPDGDCNE